MLQVLSKLMDLIDTLNVAGSAEEKLMDEERSGLISMSEQHKHFLQIRNNSPSALESHVAVWYSTEALLKVISDFICSRLVLVSESIRTEKPNTTINRKYFAAVNILRAEVWLQKIQLFIYVYFEIYDADFISTTHQCDTVFCSLVQMAKRSSFTFHIL